jgi:hypothetical protein
MASEKKKRIYFEEIKARHTTHWDLDYLNKDELDALYRKKHQTGDIGNQKPKWFLRRTILKVLLIGSIAMLLLVLFLLFFR